jgi:hypothetical protein
MGDLTQAQVEALYSQRQVHTVLHESIRHELDGFLINWSLRTWYAIDNYLNGTYYESKNKRIAELKAYVEKKGIETLLIRIMAAVIHTDQEQTYQQVIGYLQATMPHEHVYDRALCAAELIALGSSPDRRGMYCIVPRKNDMSIVEVNYWHLIEQHLTDSMDWINATGFNPPLVEKPLPVTSNRNCGYHTIKEPVILGALTDHDEQQNLEAINQLNEIEWVIDPHVRAEPERPGKPHQDQQSHENFVQMVRESNFVYDMLGDDPFWFAWQYDCRGRMYSHGYHVNLQAAEYKKALLNFNHYEELT